MVREFWLALQNRKISSCCMAFFTVLSCHTCLVQSVCSHAGNDLTQKLPVKKQHRLRNQSPQSGSSTPEFLSTVLGNTCRCRSCTPLLAQCLEFCGGIILCWADAAPVECAEYHGFSCFSPPSQTLSIILVVQHGKNLQTSRGECEKRVMSVVNTACCYKLPIYFLSIFSAVFPLFWLHCQVKCATVSFLLFEACLAKGLEVLWDVFLSSTAVCRD